ncbi:MAG: hypothetical protein A3H45_13380 [Ignavibacteria bacterium RIFCSPLOWO2_02_FULL_55_14]|nr:MAG: hypothetical protein A3H45_13380 [Ignavibacteria bacterium RIFCSPLOWO2_02_FULL_55_14]
MTSKEAALKLSRVFLLLFFFSCKLPTDPDDLDMTDDRGAVVATTNSTGGRHLVWSRATNEILWIDYDRSGDVVAQAVNPSTFEIRTLASYSGVGLYDDQHIALSDDGECFAFILRDNQGSSLNAVLVRTGDASLITTDVHSFVISPDHRLFAYAYPSYSETEYNVEVCALVGGEKALGAGRPLCFSPTGEELLIAIDTMYAVVNVSSGQRRMLATPYHYGQLYAWVGSDMCSFYVVGNQFNVTHFEPYWVETMEPGLSNADPTFFEWSADCRTALVWSTECLKSHSVGLFQTKCDVLEANIHALHLTSKEVRRVAFARIATAKESSTRNGIVFSPDERQIAYVLETNVYVKDLPLITP